MSRVARGPDIIEDVVVALLCDPSLADETRERLNVALFEYHMDKVPKRPARRAKRRGR